MRFLQKRLRNGGSGIRRLLIEWEGIFGECGPLIRKGLLDRGREVMVAYTYDPGCRSLGGTISRVPDKRNH